MKYQTQCRCIKSFTNKERFPDIYFWNCTPGIKVQQIQNNAQKNQCLCTNIKTNATTATSSWTFDTKTCSDCHLICCYAQGSYFELRITGISILLGRL